MMKKRLVSLCLALVFVLGLVPVGAFGAEIEASGTCGAQGDNVRWSLDSDGVMTISGSGAMEDYSVFEPITRSPWYEKHLAHKVTKLVIEPGVTTVGDSAFLGCNIAEVSLPEGLTRIGAYGFEDNEFTEIEIPGTVTAIGDGAFSATDLIELTVPDSVKTIGKGAFSSSDLTRITLPKGLTEISDQLFWGCSKLEEIKIPDTVTSIGDDAFVNCWGLTEVTIPDSVTTMGESAFYNCTKLEKVKLPNRLTEIRDRAFGMCESLKEITIPGTVTALGLQSFGWCDSLKEITIPKSVKTVGEDAFYSCDGLEKVTLSEGLTELGDEAFYHCSALKEITLPNSLTAIGDNAFGGCDLFTRITIPKNVTSIGQSVFPTAEGFKEIAVAFGNPAYVSQNGVLFNKTKSVLIRYPAGKPDTEYTVPSTVTAIEGGAFSWSRNLTSVTIPGSVKEIRSWGAFYGCTNLETAILCDGLTTLGDGAFQYTGLMSITLPATLTSVGKDAFSSCRSLSSASYTGSSTEWNKLKSEGVGENNSRLTNLKPSCTLVNDVSITYPAAEGGQYKTLDGLSFSLSWLDQDSGRYNHDLAIISLAMTMVAKDLEDKEAGYSLSNATQYTTWFFEKLGFRNCSFTGYRISDDGEKGTIGVSVASQEVDGTPYLAVALRGGGYGNGGWAGDFDVGAGAYADHAGFEKAAKFARGEIEAYMKQHSIDPEKVHIWLAGFSRSAATANLLSTMLRGRSDSPRLCKKENLYTYTFATPCTQMERSKYITRTNDNIFNIVNPIDAVPMVPLRSWGFGKQGTTYYLPVYSEASGSQAAAFAERFREITGTDYRSNDNQKALVAAILSMASSAVPDRNTFYVHMQDMVMKLMMGDTSGIDALMHGVTTVDELKELLDKVKESIKAGSPALAKYYSGKIVIKLAKVIKLRQEMYGSDDPYLGLLSEACKLAESMATDAAVWLSVYLTTGRSVDIDTWESVQMLEFILDIMDQKFTSQLLMQHWPEVYMAWLQTIDAGDLEQTSDYRLAELHCPVDVEVYDESGALVARTVTETVTAEDEDTGETLTFDVSVVDEDVTVLEAVTVGESKFFVFPDDQEYRVVIKANDACTAGDTMSYAVTGYEGGVPTETVRYDDLALAEGAEYDASVTTTDNRIETCTISVEEQAVEPTGLLDYQSSIRDLRVEPNDAGYTVTGTLSVLDQDAVLYCAVYTEEGRMLSVRTCAMAAGGDPSFLLDVPLQEEEYELRLFVLRDGDSGPLDMGQVVVLQEEEA